MRKVGDHERAIALLSELVAVGRAGPSNVGSMSELLNLAVAYGDVGAWDEAWAAIEEAEGLEVRVTPTDRGYVHHLKGNLLRAMGRHEEALEALAITTRMNDVEQLAHVFPLRVSVHLLSVAATYYEMGRFDEGLTRYAEAVGVLRSANHPKILATTLVLSEPEWAAEMRGWAGKRLGGESPGRRDSGASGVEVVGQGRVELEVGNGVGLGGVEGRCLIEEPGEEIALGRSAGRREGRGLVGEVEVFLIYPGLVAEMAGSVASIRCSSASSHEGGRPKGAVGRRAPRSRLARQTVRAVRPGQELATWGVIARPDGRCTPGVGPGPGRNCKTPDAGPAEHLLRPPAPRRPEPEKVELPPEDDLVGVSYYELEAGKQEDPDAYAGTC